MIINVYYETFDSLPLLRNKTAYSYMIKGSLFGIMQIKESIDYMLFKKCCYSEIILSYEFIKTKLNRNETSNVTNFIQLVSPQPVDLFLQTKLYCKAPNEYYPHICGIYKRLRYQAISSCKSFVC